MQRPFGRSDVRTLGRSDVRTLGRSDVRTLTSISIFENYDVRVKCTSGEMYKEVLLSAKHVELRGFNGDFATGGFIRGDMVRLFQSRAAIGNEIF